MIKYNSWILPAFLIAKAPPPQKKKKKYWPVGARTESHTLGDIC